VKETVMPRKRRRTPTATRPRPKRTPAPRPPRPVPAAPAARQVTAAAAGKTAARLARTALAATALGAGTLARAHSPAPAGEDRRDGAGLAASAAAAALAALTWQAITSGPGQPLQAAARDVAGQLAVLLPVLAAVTAWRLFRHPRAPRTVHLLAGLAGIFAGLTALADVAAGLPGTSGGLAGLRGAGGLPGWLITALPARLGGHTAGPVLAVAVALAIAAAGLRTAAGRPLRTLPRMLAPRPRLHTTRPRPDGAARAGRDVQAPPPAAPGQPGTPAPPAGGDTAGHGAEVPGALPPLDLLPPGPARPGDDGAADAMQASIQDTMTRYNVAATVTGYTRGPAITRYEIRPEPGTRVKKVTELAPEFAIAARTEDVRILPVIPGKAAIGVEIPNTAREIVALGDILRSPAAGLARHPLLIGMGKDTDGHCVTGNLARLLHILIGGATGGGKSGVLNALIISLLMHATPQQLRMLLIDPKQVELTAYRNLPHLAAPIITDPALALIALQEAAAEMDSRYTQMARHGIRNIDDYNRAVAAGHITGKPMSYLAITIDELADLMLMAPKDTEKAIVRITQLGRAAGEYLIAATQRPSVDVVTGLIKANMPTRVALETASATDSRVILDQGGAELLTGQGDALCLPAGARKPTRLQWAWVPEPEIAAVTSWWAANAAAGTVPAEAFA
jgi:S-DNA-T family DNA segregation ATPase FtsK/SpoIIIE